MNINIYLEHLSPSFYLLFLGPIIRQELDFHSQQWSRFAQLFWKKKKVKTPRNNIFRPLLTPSSCFSVSWAHVFVVLCPFGKTGGSYYCCLKTCILCHMRAGNVSLQTNTDKIRCGPAFQCLRGFTLKNNNIFKLLVVLGTLNPTSPIPFKTAILPL